jgi:hypothetical protein
VVDYLPKTGLGFNHRLVYNQLAYFYCLDSVGTVEEHAPAMNSGDEGGGELSIARSDSPPTLEGAEDDFNDVPCPIQFMIVRSLLFPAFNRRG